MYVIQKIQSRIVVQWTEQSLAIPKARGSHPISKLGTLFSVNFMENLIMKKHRGTKLLYFQ